MEEKWQTYFGGLEQESALQKHLYSKEIEQIRANQQRVQQEIEQETERTIKLSLQKTEEDQQKISNKKVLAERILGNIERLRPDYGSLEYSRFRAKTNSDQVARKLWDFVGWSKNLEDAYKRHYVYQKVRSLLEKIRTRKMTESEYFHIQETPMEQLAEEFASEEIVLHGDEMLVNLLREDIIVVSSNPKKDMCRSTERDLLVNDPKDTQKVNRKLVDLITGGRVHKKF